MLSAVVRMGGEEVHFQGLTDLDQTGLEDWVSYNLHTMEKEEQ